MEEGRSDCSRDFHILYEYVFTYSYCIFERWPHQDICHPQWCSCSETLTHLCEEVPIFCASETVSTNSIWWRWCHVTSTASCWFIKSGRFFPSSHCLCVSLSVSLSLGACPQSLASRLIQPPRCKKHQGTCQGYRGVQRSERHRKKGRIYSFECRVPKNSKER